MNFKLTEDQLILQKMVRDFTAHNIEPAADQIEQTCKLHNNLIKYENSLMDAISALAAF